MANSFITSAKFVIKGWKLVRKLYRNAWINDRVASCVRAKSNNENAFINSLHFIFELYMPSHFSNFQIIILLNKRIFLTIFDFGERHAKRVLNSHPSFHPLHFHWPFEWRSMSLAKVRESYWPRAKKDTSSGDGGRSKECNDCKKVGQQNKRFARRGMRSTRCKLLLRFWQEPSTCAFLFTTVT